MASTRYEIQFIQNRNNDLYILFESKQIAPYEYWSLNFENISFLRPSVFDLHTHDSNRNFQSVIKNVYIIKHLSVFGLTFLPALQNKLILQIGKTT